MLLCLVYHLNFALYLTYFLVSTRDQKTAIYARPRGQVGYPTREPPRESFQLIPD